MRGAALVLLLGAALGRPLAAQDSVPPAPPVAATDSGAAADSIARPISPMGAFWRSLLIPGWGQATLDRKLAAALFLGWEAVTLGMALKTDVAVAELGDAGSGLLESKRQEREDWLVLLGFNHLMAALEAYVSAHLWDFPGDLRIRRAPGRTEAGLRLPLSLPR
ncbi:MAG TPA: hypothetical protein VLA95_08490 [Gemmatimonadales bacterium]|nr:hypothetical protein [Gemmatimonadales bacterium]